MVCVKRKKAVVKTMFLGEDLCIFPYKWVNLIKTWGGVDWWWPTASLPVWGGSCGGWQLNWRLWTFLHLSCMYSHMVGFPKTPLRRLPILKAKFADDDDDSFWEMIVLFIFLLYPVLGIVLSYIPKPLFFVFWDSILVSWPTRLEFVILLPQSPKVMGL